MTNSCITYVANEGYLFGTLLSALQARRHTSRELADVAIFCVGEPGKEASVVASVCAAESILFKVVPLSILDGSDFRYARLFLDRFVPEQYDQLLYLDGDTQVCSSLDELIKNCPAPGRFAAVRDALVFSLNETTGLAGRQREHLVELGIPEANWPGYFNSGVMRINRNGYAELGQRAMAAYQAKATVIKYFDQDVLNIAGIEVCDHISPRWNFPSHLLGRLDRSIPPAIIHFMAHPKPWHGPLPPWGKRYHQPYLDLASRFPQLSPFRPRMSGAKYLRYMLQQRAKKHWMDRAHIANAVEGYSRAVL